LTLKYNTSLKYGAAHDAPWLTVESDNEEELHAALESLAAPDSGFFAALGRAIGAFKTGSLLGEVLGAQAVPPAQAGPPAWAAGPSQPAGGFTAPPAAAPGEAKYCEHGMRSLKTGVGSNGKPYMRYDCPSRVCPAEWGNNR
jgi:hypothetical protein